VNTINVVIGFLGATLDSKGYKDSRWDKWRPTLSLFELNAIIQIQLLMKALMLIKTSKMLCVAKRT